MKTAILIILIAIVGYLGFIAMQSRQTADLNNEAVRLIDEGRYAEAIPLLEKASAADPQNVSILRNLAEAHDQQGNTSKAIEAYRSLVAKAPDDTMARDRLTQLEKEGPLLERASQRVAQIRARGWQDDGATLDQTLNAADASWNVGNWQQAITLYERALVKDPTDTSILKRIEEIEDGLRTGKLK